MAERRTPRSQRLGVGDRFGKGQRGQGGKGVRLEEKKKERTAKTNARGACVSSKPNLQRPPVPPHGQRIAGMCAHTGTGTGAQERRRGKEQQTSAHTKHCSFTCCAAAEKQGAYPKVPGRPQQHLGGHLGKRSRTRAARGGGRAKDAQHAHIFFLLPSWSVHNVVASRLSAPPGPQGTAFHKPQTPTLRSEGRKGSLARPQRGFWGKLSTRSAFLTFLSASTPPTRGSAAFSSPTLEQEEGGEGGTRPVTMTQREEVRTRARLHAKP